MASDAIFNATAHENHEGEKTESKYLIFLITHTQLQ